MSYTNAMLTTARARLLGPLLLAPALLFACADPPPKRTTAAPVTRHPTAAPVTRHAAPAPVTRRLAPAPVTRRLAPAPVTRRSLPVALPVAARRPPVAPIAPRPPPVKPLDCAKRLPPVPCCRARTSACKRCRKEAKALALGYKLKCKIRVPRRYTACGCGCCGGMGLGRRAKCLYFRNGDDIRKIIAGDRATRKMRYCRVAGCSMGTPYKYCD